MERAGGGGFSFCVRSFVLTATGLIRGKSLMIPAIVGYVINQFNTHKWDIWEYAINKDG